MSLMQLKPSVCAFSSTVNVSPCAGSGPGAPSIVIWTPNAGVSCPMVMVRFADLAAAELVVVVGTTGRDAMTEDGVALGLSDGTTATDADGVALGSAEARALGSPFVGRSVPGFSLKALAMKYAPVERTIAPRTSGPTRLRKRMRASARCMLATMRSSCGSFGAYASARL